MLEETKYIDEVWNRYNEYMLGNLKNDFYETRVYNKENTMEKLLRTVAMFIFAIVFTVGVVYAGIAIYNNYIKHSIYSEYSINVSKSWVNDNMEYSKEVNAYYSVITNYEDYLIYKKKFKDMNNLNETDFTENFVVLIVSQLTNVYKVNVDMITVEENTLYIDLTKDNINENAKTLHTLIIPKEQYRENIELRRVYEKPASENIPLENISENYSLEQAIADGCIVLNNGKLVSENENKIYEFIENTQNGKEEFIRIVEYYENSTKIKVQDVRYKDGMYLYAVKENERILKYGDNDFAKIRLYENEESKNIELYNEGDINRILYLIQF